MALNVPIGSLNHFYIQNDHHFDTQFSLVWVRVWTHAKDRRSSLLKTVAQRQSHHKLLW